MERALVRIQRRPLNGNRLFKSPARALFPISSPTASVVTVVAAARFFLHAPIFLAVCIPCYTRAALGWARAYSGLSRLFRVRVHRIVRRPARWNSFGVRKGRTGFTSAVFQFRRSEVVYMGNGWISRGGRFRCEVAGIFGQHKWLLKICNIWTF